VENGMVRETRRALHGCPIKDVQKKKRQKVKDCIEIFVFGAEISNSSTQRTKNNICNEKALLEEHT